MPASKIQQDSASGDADFRLLSFELISQLCSLLKTAESDNATLPSLSAGAHSQIWTARDNLLAASRDRVLELSRTLCQLLQGPHEYFHDIISQNWDLGALYTIIDFGILGKIPANGTASVFELAKQTGLHERKLLNILRLATCSNVLCEIENGVFCHTVLSEELLHDEKFRAFIGFQLYETRIASANLADSLKVQPNSFENGQSAFRYSMGAPLYQWHAANEDKGQRFRMAMESVTQTLDPGDGLFRTWFEQNIPHDSPETTVVDVLGGNRMSQHIFSEQFHQVCFETAAKVEDVLSLNKPILAYTVRNVFWNKTDKEVVSIISEVINAMKQHPEATLLINEMLSASRGEFGGEYEHAYRRRDVTTMTMHNAKQRTKPEWIELFDKTQSNLQVQLRTAHSSHSYRGLWEIRLSQSDN